jgi:hypothetical protein
MEVFFRSQQWKEVLIFLFFLLLSSGFWFLQSLQRDYERKIELPLHYKNVPQEWILANDNPEKITVLVKDKGSTLMYYFWSANFSPIDVSVANLSRAADHSLHVTNQELETMLSKQLISSTSILAIEPREIHLRYDSLSRHAAAVVADVVVQTKPGFQLSGQIILSHPEVQLYGRSQVIDTLRYIKTKRATFENVSATRDYAVALDLPEGVKADHETVKLTIPVEEFTEKKLRLPVLCSDMPSTYALRIFPSSVEVTCNIPLSSFKELTEEEVEIRIPFQDFQEYQSTGKLPLRITRKPPWVAGAVIVPDEVEFIIEQLRND